MRYLLVHHPAVARALPVANEVKDLLHLLNEDDVRIVCMDDLESIDPESVDMVLTFGGDGTIIHTVKHFIDTETPLLGINLGHVGFLTNLEVSELAEYIPKLVAGDYKLENRSVLEAEIVDNGEKSGPFYCVNELCIKSPKAHMLNFYVMIDEDLHSSFRGDGMLISTPTGSTAYSLSAGGPVIDPELKVILITPLVSFLLSKRPMLMSGDHSVTLLGNNEQEAFITIDGSITHITQTGFRIIVRQADHHMRLVNVRKRTFFAGLEKRLGQTAAPL